MAAFSQSPGSRKPTPLEVRAAAGKTLNDVLAPGLRVVFCGINPGLYSAAAGHAFARPGNRFWPTLHAAGFTDRRLFSWEEEKLLEYGCGLTNIVNRATAQAAELSNVELMDGGRRLVEKIARYQPKYLAVLGLGAYRVAFGRPEAFLGPQPEKIGDTTVWALPSPSGLNAFYKPNDLARLYGALRRAASGNISGSRRKRGGFEGIERPDRSGHASGSARG